MIMKRISKIYKKLFVAVAALCLMSSCNDYLTIIPPDKITEEHYWQTKDDVNGILAKAYLDLLSTDAVQRAIIWGELRADNLTFPSSAGRDLKYIVEANLLDDNGYCRWSVYYKAIQTANLVIDRAPQVVDRDPDFTEGDLQVVLGEMYALRALAHFYLVRAFRDIPMALEVVADDSDMPEYSQVHPLEALNYIMADLDKAQDLVMKSGSYVKDEQNYGRITENAVLAIKADVNLWRAAFASYYDDDSKHVAAGDVQKYYDECVQNCEDILSKMKALYEKNLEGKESATRYAYDLLQNDAIAALDKKSTVYDEIFGTKNSRESILELQVEGKNIENGWAGGVSSMFGADGKRGAVIVPANFAAKKYQRDDLRFCSYTNLKSLSSNAQGGSSSSNSEPDDVVIAKYQAKSSPAKDYRKGDDFDANWIIYRKTDVLLMMAEAMAARPSATTDDYEEAFNIVNAINTRSRMDTTNIYKPLKLNDYKSKDAVLDLVLDERVRELSFEGKRWFDLVRKALREKSTSNILFVADKLDSNSGVVKSKMTSIDALFMPIHIDELRYNKLLKQNPIYDKDDSTSELN